MARTASRLPVKTWYFLALGGTAAIMAVNVALIPAIPSPLVHWTLTAIAVLWGLGCAGQAWIRIDEVAREAQKSSWFWGGSFGLFAALIIATLTQAAWFAEGWTGFFVWLDANKGHWHLPQLSFLSGVLFACLAQTLGAAIGGIIWWTRAR